MEEFTSYLPERVANVENLSLLDIRDQILEGDGRLSKTAMPDGVHPSAEEFEIWAKAIDPILKDWLGEKLSKFEDRFGTARAPSELAGEPVRTKHVACKGRSCHLADGSRTWQDQGQESYQVSSEDSEVI